MTGGKKHKEIRRSSAKSFHGFTIHQDEEYLLKALELGALGYILKDADSKCSLNRQMCHTMGRPTFKPCMTNELVNEYKRIKSGNDDPPVY